MEWLHGQGLHSDVWSPIHGHAFFGISKMEPPADHNVFMQRSKENKLDTPPRSRFLQCSSWSVTTMTIGVLSSNESVSEGMVGS